MTERILLVEDDPKLGAQIVDQLEARGMVVRWVKDGDVARTAELDGISLVVLDLMLPGTHGLDLLKLFRSHSDVPVLIVSARDETADKVRGLSLGADDYLTKPFWPEELVARVTARLRRPILARGDVLTIGPFRIDVAARTVAVDAIAIDLTPTELEILITLAMRPDRAIPRDTIAERALDHGDARTLDVHVSRLRKKLGSAGKRVETAWGIGYRLRSGE